MFVDFNDLSNSATRGKDKSNKMGIFEFMHFEHHEDRNKEIYEHDEVEHEHLTRKQKLSHILHSKPVHIGVIILVIFDSLLVIFALLVDLRVVAIPETHDVVSVFHGFSISILAVFMIEISLKIYSNYKFFLHHKIEVIDAVVVVISFIVDIVLVFHETAALEALGLLVLFRLWRVLRIVNSFIVTIKSNADDKVHVFKEKNHKLQEGLRKAKDEIALKEEEIEKLKDILRENGLKYEEPEEQQEIKS